MLKGIDARLNAGVLGALRAMGHGDMLLLVDSNFPADALAQETVLGHLLTMENLTLAAAAEAVLSVMPLDTFVPDFAARMQVMDAPDEVPAVQRELQAAVDAAEARARPLPGVERFAFYDLARQSYAIIQTGERRFYGCVMFWMGGIGPEGCG